jgi:hypothetical protein
LTRHVSNGNLRGTCYISTTKDIQKAVKYSRVDVEVRVNKRLSKKKGLPVEAHKSPVIPEGDYRNRIIAINLAAIINDGKVENVDYFDLSTNKKVGMISTERKHNIGKELGISAERYATKSEEIVFLNELDKKYFEVLPTFLVDIILCILKSNNNNNESVEFCDELVSNYMEKQESINKILDVNLTRMEYFIFNLYYKLKLNFSEISAMIYQNTSEINIEIIKGSIEYWRFSTLKKMVNKIYGNNILNLVVKNIELYIMVDTTPPNVGTNRSVSYVEKDIECNDILKFDAMKIWLKGYVDDDCFGKISDIFDCLGKIKKSYDIQKIKYFDYVSQEYKSVEINCNAYRVYYYDIESNELSVKRSNKSICFVIQEIAYEIGATAQYAGDAWRTFVVKEIYLPNGIIKVDDKMIKDIKYKIKNKLMALLKEADVKMDRFSIREYVKQIILPESFVEFNNNIIQWTITPYSCSIMPKYLKCVKKVGELNPSITTLISEINNSRVNENNENFNLTDYVFLKKYIISKKCNIISEKRFMNCMSLKEIIVPEGVTIINASAFKNCQKLKKITLPLSLEVIEECAFEGCKSLENIELPSKLEKVGNYAFCGCNKINEIILPENVSEIGAGAFRDCTSLEKINIPNKIKEICKHTFCGCFRLNDIILPEKLNELGKSAFSFCTSL